MSKNETTKKSMTVFKFSSIFLGSLITIWSSAAILSGLSQVNWQVSELMRQYLISVGLMQEFHTMSDFYTHIKGVEYIIAVMFLGAFPAFFAYLNKPAEVVLLNNLTFHFNKKTWPQKRPGFFMFLYVIRFYCNIHCLGLYLFNHGKEI